MSRKGLAYLSSGIGPAERPDAGREGIQEMEDFAHALANFVREHQAWAAPIVLVLAFGESLAFISLLIPAWGALVAIGALIGASGISFWPVWIAGGIGAALGDWVSYWFGFKYKEQVAQMWPLSRYPEILPRGEAFVKNWGVPSIFIGRFFGPLRASVPLAAGIFEMSYWQFQIANFVSALVWSAALLLFGDVIAHDRRMAVADGMTPKSSGAGIRRTTRGLAPQIRKNGDRTRPLLKLRGKSAAIRTHHRLTGRTSHGTDTTSRTRRSCRARCCAAAAGHTRQAPPHRWPTSRRRASIATRSATSR